LFSIEQLDQIRDLLIAEANSEIETTSEFKEGFAEGVEAYRSSLLVLKAKLGEL